MFSKYLKWEFWPAKLFYIPIFFYYLFLSLKARSFTFFTASNPSQYLGGMAMADKFKILNRFDKSLIPKTLLIPMCQALSQVEKVMTEKQITYPVIAKPNSGERGKQVSLIENYNQLKNYLAHVNKSVLIQEFIDYPIELGIMYYRYPGQLHGNINSIVRKGFLKITGDGQSTFEELFKCGERTKYYLKLLREKFSTQLNEIPEKGKTIILQKIGNHNKGTTFYNGNDIINEELITVFDRISDQQNEFYFGRYDIKCKNIEQLYKGEGIKILELNGANSEPAHIYDPDMSLIQAYKDLIKHWNVNFEISLANRKRGIKYMPFLAALQDIINHNLKKNPAFKPE